MKLLLLKRKNFGEVLRMSCLAACLLGLAFTGRAQTDTIWGMANAGGTYNLGTLFYMNSDGSNFNIVHHFGAAGDGIGLTNALTTYKGVIYGLTNQGGDNNGDGTIFSYDPVAGAYSIVYQFDNTHGSGPVGQLTLNPANGLFYGVTTYGGAAGGGVIFSFNPVTKAYTDLVDMDFSTGSIGGYPYSSPTLYNNVLYGTNIYFDASGNSGTCLYSFDLRTNTYTVLYVRENVINTGAASMVAYNNVLYGTSSEDYQGDIFSYDLSSGIYTNAIVFDGSNGSQPVGLTLSGSIIYGTCGNGNYPNSNGSLFSYSPSSGQLNTLYAFTSATGQDPTSAPTIANGKLIGMTYYGPSYYGNVYSYDLGSKAGTDLFDFNGTNGSNLLSPLLFIHTVGATPQTITFDDATKTYGDVPFGGAVASSGLPVVYSSDNIQVAVGSGNQVRIVGVGTANITATQYGNATYDSVSVTKSVTVTAAPLLITAVDTFRNQDQADPVFRAAYTGLVNGDSAGSLTTPPTLTTTAVLSSLQGTYPISIGGAVDANYTITYAPGTLTVIGLLQEIAISDSIATYGAPDLDPGSASTGLPVTYASSNPAIASVTADQKIHVVSAGSTVITVTQAGNASYALQTRTFVLQVLPAPLLIVADNKTKIYSQSDPVFTATYTGFVNGDDTSSLTAKPVFTPTAVPGSAPGVYLVHVTGAVDSNYMITYRAGTYLLTPVTGVQTNSLNAWFSSTTSLQLDIWTTASQPALVQVFDLAGHRLVSKEVNLIQDNNTLILPAGSLTTGVYIVQVTGDNLKLTQTIRKIN